MKPACLLAALLCCVGTATAAGKTTLNRLMSADMIGLQRAYFEKIAGPAKRISDSYRQYDIRGCLVSIVEDNNKSIVSIELENLSGRCTFDAATIFLRGPAHQLTFARLQAVSIGGGAKASCLPPCGDDVAPRYGLTVRTPDAMTAIEYDAGVTNTDAAMLAAGRLREKLEMRFPGAEVRGDYLGKTIPAGVFTDMWLTEFGALRITSIRIGYNMLDR